MKNFLAYNFTVVLVLSAALAYGNASVDSLLNILDKDIANTEIYVRAKEAKIDSLRSRIALFPEISIGRYDLNNRLYNEYKAYSSDSAMHYINSNSLIARSLQDEGKALKMKMEKSRLLSQVGMYLEAEDFLESIDRRSVPDSLLGYYYGSYKHLYHEASVVRPRYRLLALEYKKKSNMYRDSMMAIISPTSDLYLSELEFSYHVSKDYEKALEINDQQMKLTTIGEAQYALVAYNRFRILKEMSEGHEESMRYLILSAISDVRSAIKEQSSIMLLAQMIYNNGDLKRAHAYINYSWQITDDYKTRMRNWRHIAPLSMINASFQDAIDSQNKQLQSYLMLIAFLVLLLVVALMFIYRQIKKLRLAKQGLQDMNGQLHTMNDELEVVNETLHTANVELSESNKIKEVYVARFF